MEKQKELDAGILKRFTGPDKDQAGKLFQDEYSDFDKKIIVLDDDPTGTQTVHDVSVYTDWSQESILEGFREEENMFFLLTNSRSFSAGKTAEVHREIGECIAKAGLETGKDYLVISRGDSTLRGHYPLEMEILRESLEQHGGYRVDGEILCPFFREGGRFTIDGVHYVQDKERLIPAAQTEFAGDATFGYSHSDLGEYVEEKTGGRKKAGECIRISLDMLKGMETEKITEKLLSARDFATVIVDSVSYEDTKVFAAAFLRAVRAGKRFLIRSAAAVPKVLGNISDRPLLTAEQLIISKKGESAGTAENMAGSSVGSTSGGISVSSAPESISVSSAPGGIVLVGSHVRKTTAQLEDLRKMEGPLTFLEFDVNTCFGERGLESEADRIAGRAMEEMTQGRTAVVYTSRSLFAPEGYSKEELLQASVRISDAVTSVIEKLTVKPRFIIAKGGITSSDVATKALKIKKAVVMGQVQPGIPVWMTGEESKFPGMPYVIFPGNVGNEDTLRKVVEACL